MTVVRDLMSSPVVTLTPQKTAYDVAVLMNQKDIETIVVTWGDNVVGILTEKDLVRKVIAQNKSYSIKISEIMSNPVISIEANASIRKAKGVMKRHNIKRLTVIEKGKLVGIITASDLMKK